MSENNIGFVDQIATEIESSSAFNISRFRAEMKTKGIIQNNRFLVMFVPPKIMRNSTSRLDSSFLTLRCEDINIPGVNFFTAENIRRQTWGPVERRPYLPQFNPISMNFIVDRNCDVVNYFDNWTNSIVNYDRRNSSSKNKPYFLNYKDDYICPQMEMLIYDETYRVKARYILFDAYPQTTSDMGMSWGSTDTATKYSVTMQYTDMAIEFENSVVRDVRSVTDILGKYTKIPSFSETITTIAGKTEGRLYGFEELFINKVID